MSHRGTKQDELARRARQAFVNEERLHQRERGAVLAVNATAAFAAALP
jgi:hypothetical protein